MLRSIVRASMVEDVFGKNVCIRWIRTGGDRQPDGDRWRSPDILGRQRDQQLVTAFPDWGIDDAIHLFTGVEAQHRAHRADACEVSPQPRDQDLIVGPHGALHRLARFHRKRAHANTVARQLVEDIVGFVKAQVGALGHL